MQRPQLGTRRSSNPQPSCLFRTIRPRQAACSKWNREGPQAGKPKWTVMPQVWVAYPSCTSVPISRSSVHWCGKTGHLRKVCRGKPNSCPPQQNPKKKQRGRAHQVLRLDGEDEETSEEDYPLLHVHAVHGQNTTLQTLRTSRMEPLTCNQEEPVCNQCTLEYLFKGT